MKTLIVRKVLVSMGIVLGLSTCAVNAQEVFGFVVTNTNDNGPGSLRQAILDANAAPGTDTINFDIPGAAPFTIAPTSSLPIITDSVIIDGTTQPGFAGTPIIELSGAAAEAGAFGLTINAGNSTVRGLVINRFTGAGIRLQNAGGNTIQGNFIGTDVTGTVGRGVGNGSSSTLAALLIMDNSPNNIIGGTTPAARNLISGSNSDGLFVWFGCSGTIIQGNFIGTDITGTVAIPNGGNGVRIESVDNNLVGGTSAGAANVISGNGASGVMFVNSASLNVVQGNLIGVAANGTGAMGNGLHGIQVASGSNNNIIGGTGNGAANTIAFNGGSGVGIGVLNGAGLNNAILSNAIFGNTGLGIDLGEDGPTPNDPGDSDAGANNLQNSPQIISANLFPGGNLTLTYSVPSAVTNSTYPLHIEFYLADTDGQEGESLLTTDTYSAGDAGASKSITLSESSVPLNTRLVATATEEAGNTSEFSLAAQVSTDLTISSIPNVTILKNTSTGPLPFTIANADSLGESSAISADSSNATLVPQSSITLTGTGVSRTVTVTPQPNLTGTTTITLSIFLGEVSSVSTSYQVTVVDALVCPGNTSWPNACLLNPLPIAPNKKSVAIDQSLDQLDQSRWYKFSVPPESSLVVALTSLPANYDLFLFKDIGAAYQALVSNKDLARIGAESSPTAFSPTAFSDDAFAPTAFSPTAFSPTAFSPTAFSPTESTPTAFSPTAFSPTAFSPDQYSSDDLSQRTFNPAGSPNFSPTAFSGAQTSSLIGVSAFPGTAGEGIFMDTWDNSGEFYVLVRGRNGAFLPNWPFHLDVVLIANEPCGPVNPLPPSNTPVQAGVYKTLILTYLDRMEGTLDEKSLLKQRLETFRARREVQGVVVDVGNDQRVKAAALDAEHYDPGLNIDNRRCPFFKNRLAAAIKDIVTAYRTSNPLEYVILVGNDDGIPFFRYPDLAELGNEKTYPPPVRDDTTSQASLRRGRVMSQDAYGAVCEISTGVASFPIPNLPVGRLVETAADVTGMIDFYSNTAQGVVPEPKSALVTGYDFLRDAAAAIRDELTAGLGQGKVDDQLISPPGQVPTEPNAWTAVQLRDKLIGTRHDIIFLAGHFSAVDALAADFHSHLFTETVAAAPVDLANAIIYSAGCHSGYSIVDRHDVTFTDAQGHTTIVTLEPDWAQTFAHKGALFIGGTGYQYGDTDLLEYSERLYLEFTKQLRNGAGPVSVGKAFAKAKRVYLASTPVLSGLHEKVLLESTLFGFPMLSVDLPSGRTTTPGSASIVSATVPYPSDPGLTLGLTRADVTVATPTTVRGPFSLTLYPPGPPAVIGTLTHLSGESQFTRPLEPILPLFVRNVTVNNILLRGVGFRGGTYEDEDGVTPLTGAPVTEIRGVHLIFSSDFFYPVQPWSVNYFDDLCGGDGTTRFMLLPSQFRSASPGAQTGTRRKFDDMSFRLFYSANTTTYGASTPGLSAAPSISNVSDAIVEVTPGHFQVQFMIRTTGDPAAGMQEVWVTYTDVDGAFPRKWQSIDLAQDGGNSTLWTGMLATDHPEAIRYSVTAVNGVGLATQDTRLGYFYTPGEGNRQPEPTTLTLGPVGSPQKYANYASLSATLTRTRNGAPLQAQVVMFGVGSQRVQAVTDGNGIALIPMKLLDSPGEDYRVQATFPGTDDLSGSSDTSPSFTIAKQDVQISLTLKDSTVEATLSDLSSDHQPLAERTIFFVVTDQSQGTVFHTKPVITDFAGVALLGAIPLPQGTYQVTAYFGGSVPLPNHGNILLTDERYDPAAASITIRFTAVPATLIYIGDTAASVQDFLHLATMVSAPGDLTLATVEFRLSDSAGRLVTEPILATVAADGFSSAAFSGPVGVYQLRVQVVGASYTSNPILVTLVIYDSSGGFVTAGGWIDSPAGAYVLDPRLNGKANLAVVAKYLKGKTLPDGNTQFQLKGAKLNFSSTSYDWLAVSGARAEYQGTGTINGSGSYAFLVTAIDGQVNGGKDPDKVRLKIWSPITGAVVYDNQMSAPDGADPTMVLGGGNIDIHK